MLCQNTIQIYFNGSLVMQCYIDLPLIAILSFCVSGKQWDAPSDKLYKDMSDFMVTRLDSSAYGFIDLHKLFSKIILPGTVLPSA